MKVLNLQINENELSILNHIVNEMQTEVEVSIKENYGEHRLTSYNSLWDKVQDLRGELLDDEGQIL